LSHLVVVFTYSCSCLQAAESDAGPLARIIITFTFIFPPIHGKGGRPTTVFPVQPYEQGTHALSSPSGLWRQGRTRMGVTKCLPPRARARVGRVGDGPMLFMGHSLPSRPLRVVNRENHGLALWRLPDEQEDISQCSA
jgi:hypothetical protein